MITAKIENVTPEMAAQWLETHNTGNRSIRLAHVTRLASDMSDGNWVASNGESIKFDIDGRLVDGQHRLSACVLANIPISCLVVRGVAPDCYATIDIGRQKNTSDFLAANAFKNATLMASTAKLLALHQDGNLANMKDGKVSPTTARVLQIIEDNPTLTDSAAWTHGNPVSKLLTVSFACLIHYVATQQGHSAAVSAFLDRIGNGLGLRDYEPVYHLRKFLLAHKSAKRKAAQPFVLALAIKAWIYAKNEKSVNDLRFRTDEKFPVL